MQWLNTRTEMQRRELAKRFTQVMVDVVGVSKDIVNVIFDEIDPRMHAKGGVFYSDILKKAPAKRKTRKAPAKRAAAKKTPAKKAVAKKAPAKKAVAKKAPAKKAVVKKAPAKRTTARRAPTGKATTRRASATRKR